MLPSILVFFFVFPFHHWTQQKQKLTPRMPLFCFALSACWNHSLVVSFRFWELCENVTYLSCGEGNFKYRGFVLIFHLAKWSTINGTQIGLFTFNRIQRLCQSYGLTAFQTLPLPVMSCTHILMWPIYIWGRTQLLQVLSSSTHRSTASTVSDWKYSELNCILSYVCYKSNCVCQKMGQLWSDPGPRPGLLHQAIQQNDINELFRLLDSGMSVSFRQDMVQAKNRLFQLARHACVHVSKDFSIISLLRSMKSLRIVHRCMLPVSEVAWASFSRCWCRGLTSTSAGSVVGELSILLHV